MPPSSPGPCRIAYIAITTPYSLGDAPRILLPATPTTTNSHHGCGYNEWQDSVCDVGVGGVSVWCVHWRACPDVDLAGGDNTHNCTGVVRAFRFEEAGGRDTDLGTMIDGGAYYRTQTTSSPASPTMTLQCWRETTIAGQPASIVVEYVSFALSDIRASLDN